MNCLDPDLACPHSLKDALRLGRCAIHGGGTGGGLVAAEDCLSCAGEGLSE